jgi:peptidyl-prolyl cis-trans isomerase A (cyclophilin A)/peptidyl-prolyl cis-trans isomerase B (cyclophilin B)
MRIVKALVLGTMLVLGCSRHAGTPDGRPVDVVVETSMGRFTVRLNAAKAPATVANFLRYVDEGFYAGTVFHRVITGFMIQGGGLTPELSEKPTHSPIRNEAANGLKNRRGTIAMARTSNPDSATAQFFVNLVDNGFLDFRDPSPGGIGYAVFGEVTEGMDVVTRIGDVPTGMQGGMGDVPLQPVIIQSIKRAP